MYKEQSPQEVLGLIKQDSVLILDVREPEEWAAGHIPGATHIPLGQIAKALNELDPKQETVVVCRSGNRSGQACAFLSSMGYRVVNMTGGMSGWTGPLAYGN